MGAGNGGQLGAGRPGSRWGPSRLADSTLPAAHILPPDEPAHFCNEPDKVFSCPRPPGNPQRPERLGYCVSGGSVAPLSVQEAAGGLPSGQYALGQDAQEALR